MLKTPSSIVLHGHNYPYTILGTGSIPCLTVGIGSLLDKTLSEKFLRMFTLYSSDLYWVKKTKLKDPQKLSLRQIEEDTMDMARQLHLQKPLLLAHSCFGIVALEIAKRYPNISGVILIASPPIWSPASIAFARTHFDEHASPERKENDRSRQEAYQKVKTPHDCCVNIHVYEADTARYWADFTLSHDFLQHLWDGVEIDDALGLHFWDTLLPHNDMTNQMNAINVPVYLIAGQHDYDSVPLELWKQYPKPKLFTLIDCKDKAGHWPHIECPDLFDSTVENWIYQNSPYFPDSSKSL